MAQSESEYLQEHVFDLLPWCVISGSGMLFINVMDLKEWLKMQTERMSLQIKVIQSKQSKGRLYSWNQPHYNDLLM